MRFRFAAMHFTVSFSVVSFFIPWHFVCFTFVFLCIEIRMIWTRREWNWNNWKVNENEIYLLLHLVCLEWHSVMVEWWKLKNWQQHFFFYFLSFSHSAFEKKTFSTYFFAHHFQLDFISRETEFSSLSVDARWYFCCRWWCRYFLGLFRHQFATKYLFLCWFSLVNVLLLMQKPTAVGL